jgi:hypothetical protein
MSSQVVAQVPLTVRRPRCSQRVSPPDQREKSFGALRVLTFLPRRFRKPDFIRIG